MQPSSVLSGLSLVARYELYSARNSMPMSNSETDERRHTQTIPKTFPFSGIRNRTQSHNDMELSHAVRLCLSAGLSIYG